MEKFGRVCKEYMVNDIAEHFKDYPNFFITTFSKVSAADMEKLRKVLKKADGVYMVAKNSMVKHAIKKSEKNANLLEEVTPLMSGSCGVLFSKDDPTMIVRSLVNFSKEHESLSIQGGFVNGEKMPLDTIKLLAALPSKDVLLAMAISGIKAPISGFAGVLRNLLQNLVGVIDAISKKNGES